MGYKVKRIMMWVNQVRLPSEYQEVEYIQSSGTQWIDSGYTPKSTSELEVKFQNVSNINTYRTILGTRYSTTANAFWIGYANNDSYYEFSPTNTHLNNSSLGWDKTGVDYTIEFKNKNLINNGTTVATSVNFTQNANYTLYLFAGHAYNQSNPFEPSASKIYYCKLREGGTLVRNLIPCYRKSDSVIGMYDLVNSVFYTNSGSGAFSKGNDVPDMVEKQVYPVYEWKPGVNTLIYYPLTSDLVDVMRNGNTGTNNGGCTFNATDGATSGVYVQGQNSKYIKGMSLGVNSKTTCTMNVWANFISKSDHGSIVGYNSNYPYTQPFKIYCGTDTTIRFGVFKGTSSSNGGNYISDTTAGPTLNSGYHNYCFTVDSGVLKMYIDGQPITYGEGQTDLNIGAVASGTSELQLGRGGYYGSGRTATGYVRDYIVETVAWSSDEILKYYNTTKSLCGVTN